MKNRQDLYKRTPDWKQKYKERCRDRLKDCVVYGFPSLFFFTRFWVKFRASKIFSRAGLPPKSVKNNNKPNESADVHDSWSNFVGYKLQWWIMS